MRLFAITSCILLAGCASTSSADKQVGLANPASVYCVKQGGKLEIREEPAGQAGYCHLPDGRVIEEWTLFRSQTK